MEAHWTHYQPWKNINGNATNKIKMNGKCFTDAHGIANAMNEIQKKCKMRFLIQAPPLGVIYLKE